jgi:streptomycin 6-kinase
MLGAMNQQAFPIPEAVAIRAPRLGAAGEAWLARLPSIIAACAERWSLENVTPFPELWYNYVASATRAGQAVAIKVCHPGHETLQEVTALRLFDGRRCARLLDFDPEDEALLLERAEPGAMIETLEDDEAEVEAAAAVMRGLWRAAPVEHPFPLASDWLKAALEPATLVSTKRNHPWVEGALARAAELAQEKAESLLLHGAHHGNILSAQREPWLAIDPQGVVGDAAWEIAPFLFNNVDRYRQEESRVARRRADQFADLLGLERERVYAWGAVRALQGAFWSLRDEAPEAGAQHFEDLVCAEALAKGA